MSVAQVLRVLMSQKNIAIFTYKQWLLSIDMKTKVVQPVPRIIFNVFKVFRFPAPVWLSDIFYLNFEAEMQKVKTFTLAAFWGPKNLRQKCVIRDKFNAIKSAWFATNWILKMLKKHYLCSKFKKKPEIIFKVQRICNSWIFTPKIAWFATK